MTSPGVRASTTERRCDVKVQERRLRLIPGIGGLAAERRRAGPGETLPAVSRARGR